MVAAENFDPVSDKPLQEWLEFAAKVAELDPSAVSQRKELREEADRLGLLHPKFERMFSRDERAKVLEVKRLGAELFLK